MKVTLHFKSGLTGIYSGVGSVCTIRKGEAVNIEEGQLSSGVLAYDDESVAMVAIEPEEDGEDVGRCEDGV